MHTDLPSNPDETEKVIEVGFEPTLPLCLLADITGFVMLIKSCFDAANNKIRKSYIQRILAAQDWCEHYRDKETGRKVLAETAANRIKEGADQASRVVIDITSDIGKRDLIDGLRSGVEKNILIKEILLIYKKKFYRLSKELIQSRNIYKVIE